MTRRIKDLPPRHELTLIKAIGRGKPLGTARAKAVREIEVVGFTGRRRKAA